VKYASLIPAGAIGAAWIQVSSVLPFAEVLCQFGKRVDRLALATCEELKAEAPGIDYDASKIAHLNVVDPWRADPDYKVPPIILTYMPMRVDHTVIQAWNEKKAA
jgi:hypothetical protein